MPRADATLMLTGRVQKILHEKGQSRAYVVWDNSRTPADKYVVWTRDDLRPNTTVTVVGHPVVEAHANYHGENIPRIVIHQARLIEVISVGPTAERTEPTTTEENTNE